MAKPRNHSINYIEFCVTDMAAAKSFYAAAFGWEFSDYGPDYAGIRDERTTRHSVCTRPGSVACQRPGGCRFHFEDPSGNELAVWSER